MYRLSRLSLLLLLPLASCVELEEDADLGEVESEISGSGAMQADLWHQSRAGTGMINSDGSPSCTVTKIAPHFVVSAAHCPFTVGRSVTYYGADDWHLFRQNTAGIVKKNIRPGVIGSASCSDKHDINGDFADIAVVQVDREDTVGVTAVMAWRYPGEWSAGEKVGAGSHDGDPNTSGLLKQINDVLWSSDGDDGLFHSDSDQVNPGDSGGPFYVNGRVVGVLNGTCDWAFKAGYTTVPWHLPWILDTIGYRWSGMTSVARSYSGTTAESFRAVSEKVCQYACENRTGCVAYNFLPTPTGTDCWLKSTVTGSTASTIYRGAVRWAPPHSSRTGNVVGFLGGDGVGDAVVHRVGSGIREIFTDGNGVLKSKLITDLTSPAVQSNITAYRRADGVSAVVYRNGSRLLEVALVGTQWQTNDLPIYIGISPKGDPAAYVRADGISAVVYRNSNNHIIELSLVGSTPDSGSVVNGWWMRDLTVELLAPPADSDPTAFVRSDGYSSIVYQAGGQIYEMYMGKDHAWSWGSPSGIANGEPAAASTAKPSGFVHHDGTNGIVYRAYNGKVVELYLTSDGWIPRDLTFNSGVTAVGDPQGYVRADGQYSSVVFRDSIGHIRENANGTLWDMGVQPIGTDPVPFVRTKGDDAVLFAKPASGLLTPSRAQELRLSFDTGWIPHDLSTEAGE
jgi:hypothetical protein